MTPLQVQEAGGSRRWTIHTPDQRLRVFVSSTLDELAPERVAARQAIAQLRLIPVMFEAGARPYPPRDVYTTYLSQSEIFVGIYWQRYGWVGPDQKISGLEDEYLLSRGKPSLFYVKAPAPDREAGLDALLDRIEDDATASYVRFSNPDELGQRISDDLALLLTERFIISRGDEARPSAGGGLPLRRAPIFGREREIAAVKRLLDSEEVRLVTLTGPGGVGKTTVALAAASASAGRFEDGAAFVSMAATMDAEMVVSSVAEVVGTHQTVDRPLPLALLDDLRPRNALLVLDNVEHLLEAAPLAAQALEAAPRLKLLATGREALRVRGEHVVMIPPLEIPGRSTRETADPDQLIKVPAVALFVECARASVPSFVLTTENCWAVGEVCRRLEGIPLAIELAAARINVLPPGAMLERLERDPLLLLSRGPRDLPARQQTLRATIEWSYVLLDEHEQRLFRRLAVFVGGFTLEAAERVCKPEPDADVDVLDGIQSLVDKSLIIRSEQGGEQARFSMLDTIHEYARERLVASQEVESTQSSHAAWYVDFAETAERELLGVDQLKWMQQLRRERDNLRGVMAWSVKNEAGDSPEMLDERRQAGLRLAAALWFFWYSDGAMREGRRYLARLDSRPNAETGPSRASLAKAIAGAGWLAYIQSEYQEAVSLAERALRLIGGEDDPTARATALTTLGSVAAETDDFDRAASLYEQSLEVVQRAQRRWWIGACLNNLGWVAYLRGDFAKAKQYVEASLKLRREFGDVRGVGWSLNNVAAIAQAEGRMADAHKSYLESLAILQQFGGTTVTAEMLEDMAGVLMALERPQLAVRVLSSAEAFRSEVGVPFKTWRGRQATYDRTVAGLRELLGRQTYAAAWSEGSKLPIDQAVAEVLAT